MNLKELREEINSALDYNPSLAAYKSQVERVVNRHYLQCSSQYQWLFMQEKRDFNIKATVSGSATSQVTIASGNLRLVTLSAGTGVFVPEMEGQTFVAPDGTEVSIVRVASTTTLYLASAVTSAAGSANWSVRFDRYALPKDCVEVLGVMSRTDDRGRLMFVNMRKEEEQFLDIDQTGDPIVMIEEESNEFQRPPDQTIKLPVRSGPTNSLKRNTTYQYCYTIVSEGIESAPSLVSEATTSGTDRSIRLEEIEDLRWSSDGVTFNDSGKRKYVYRRDKTNGTRWILIAVLDAATTLYDDETILPNAATSGTNTYDFDQVTNLFDAGPRQFVRLWWTAQSDLELEIRYAQRPRRLSADYDVPAWPVQYHHYLVYKPLEDICLQHGMTTQGQLYGRRAEELLKRMKQKYLSRSNRMFRRRGFDKDLMQVERYGIPTKV